MHVYLSYLSRSVYLERMFRETFFVPFPQPWDPGKNLQIGKLNMKQPQE